MSDVSVAIRQFENSPGWWDEAAWERVKAENARLRTQAEALAEALDFVLSFVPPWAEDVPEGLGAMFYGTLTREGDLKVKARVDDARAALRAYRRGDCPGCSFRRQTGGNHDDVPTGDADPNCAFREAPNDAG